MYVHKLKYFWLQLTLHVETYTPKRRAFPKQYHLKHGLVSFSCCCAFHVLYAWISLGRIKLELNCGLLKIRLGCSVLLGHLPHTPGLLERVQARRL